MIATPLEFAGGQDFWPKAFNVIQVLQELCTQASIAVILSTSFKCSLSTLSLEKSQSMPSTCFSVLEK